MKRNLLPKARYLAIALILGQTSTILRAEQRLPNRISSQTKTMLHGSRSPRIEGLTGSAVEDTMPVNGITFRFKPTDKLQAELDKLLEDQQNPHSPLYHTWLTPEEYGERFGLGSADYSSVREWVASQGFQVDYAAKSRSYISFSGTAGQVRKTFGTELRYYQVDGQAHFANASAVEIPTELEAVLYSIRGLDDLPEQRGTKIARGAGPTNGAAAELTPADLAAIYNLTPIYQQGISGAGQKDRCRR
jgi:subtilase family serine protease